MTASSPDPQPLPRRGFLFTLLGGATVVGGAALGTYWARHAGSRSAYAQNNPFAYAEADRYEQTDPALLHYQETARINGLRADARKLAIGPDDQLYVAAGKYVSAINSQGAARMEIQLPDPPRCLAVGAEGTLYVGLRGHIEVFDPQGRRLATWESPGPRTWLTGLAVGRDNLFAADAGNRLVLRYDLSGKIVGRIGEKSNGRRVPSFIIPSPYFDVEWHRDGLLRVNNPGRHRVQTLTPEGDLEFEWGEASASLAGFCGCCNPINLALLKDGRCVTCEKGLPRVKVYDTYGNLQSVVAGVEAFPENAEIGAGKTLDGQEGGLDAAVDSRDRIHILDLVAGDIRVMERKPKTPPDKPAAA